MNIREKYGKILFFSLEDDMNLLYEILRITLSPVAVTALLIFWGRKTIDIRISKNLELFKKNLEQILFEHKTHYSLFHEKQAEVIGILYGKIVRTASQIHRLVDIFQFSDGKPLSQKKNEVKEIGNDMLVYYYEHRIYLDEDTCRIIDNIIKTSISVYLRFDSSQTEEKYKPDPTGEWIKASKEFDNVIPELKNKLEEDLKKVLRGEKIS